MSSEVVCCYLEIIVQGFPAQPELRRVPQKKLICFQGQISCHGDSLLLLPVIYNKNALNPVLFPGPQAYFYGIAGLGLKRDQVIG